MSAIKYDWVFGVALGQQLDEKLGVRNYSRCKAAQSLFDHLARHAFFGGRRLGGTGPLFRNKDGVLKHEFNRHHAGLALDIMLDQGPDDIILGKHLVVLLQRLCPTLRYYGLIYRNVALNKGNNAAGQVSPDCYGKNDHNDHIHLDWHGGDSQVSYQPIATVPMLRKDGKTVVDLVPMNGASIATEIRTTTEAGTDFSQDATVQSEIANLMNRHSQGQLQDIDLVTGVGLVRC
jgi:hypothetical protein